MTGANIGAQQGKPFSFQLPTNMPRKAIGDVPSTFM